MLRKTFKFHWWKAILVAVLLFAGALVLGLKIQNSKNEKSIRALVGTIKPIRENNFNYQYIFPLLSYDFSQVSAYLEDKDLHAQLQAYVDSQYKSQNAAGVSVYVRNFFDNSWAGLNQDDQYHPGSLLKVLIMMAYYREAEMDPTVLQKSLVFDKVTNQEVAALQYSLPTKLSVGQSNTISQLMQYMIADSDNGAENLLIKNVDRTVLNSAYSDLSIPNPDTVAGDYTISARQYTAFLRILYNATYLTEPYSEQALSIMAQSTFKDGISAGIPSNVVVAQKYGERVSGNGDNIDSIELHDCGVVYAPNRPYAICIMTKGKDLAKLTSIIKDISGIVYNYDSSQK